MYNNYVLNIKMTCHLSDEFQNKNEKKLIIFLFCHKNSIYQFLAENSKEIKNEDCLQI